MYLNTFFYIVKPFKTTFWFLYKLLEKVVSILHLTDILKAMFAIL